MPVNDQNATITTHKKGGGRSISTSLSSSLVLLILIVVICILGVVYFHQSRRHLSALEAKAEEYITVFSDVIILPLWNYNQEHIQTIGSVISKNDLVEEVNILDKNGEILFTHKKETRTASNIVREHEVEYQNVHLGKIKIALSTIQYENELHALLKTITFALLAIILAVIAATGFLLRIFLRKPLSELEIGMARIAEGDYDYRFKNMPKQELNGIVNRFREMAGKVKEKAIALQKEITEKDAVLQALHESERKLSTLLSNLPNISVYECKNDEQWSTIYCSEGALNVYGYSAEDMMSNKVRFVDLIYPEDKLTSDDLVQDALKNRKSFESEYRIISATGEVKWVWDNGQGVFDTEGNLISIQGVVADINDRKKAEEALKENEYILTEAQRIAKVGNYLWNLENNSFVLSNEVDRIFGFVSKGLNLPVPEMLENIIHPKDKEYVKNAFDKFLETEIGVPLEYRILRKDGTIRWIFAAPPKIQQRDKQNKPLKIMGTLQDITESKLAQEELRRTKSYLNNVINSMPSILVGIDRDGKIINMNKEAETLSGIDGDKAAGSSVADIFPHYSEYLEDIKMAIRKNEIIEKHKVPLNINGENIFVNIAAYPLVANGIEGAVIRIDNVSEKVHLEEMMIQTEKMLSVGGLAAGMAHEINNPLAGILQNIQVIRNRISRNIPKNRKTAEACGTSIEAIQEYMVQREMFEMIESIMDSGKRAAKIVDNMLSFSRKSASYRVPYRLDELLDKTVELAGNDYDLKKRYDFRQIKIIREYDETLPQVPCEAGQIQQVMLNLLKNGAQAMAGIASDKTHQFTLRIMQEGSMARIEIEDNGPGMTEETRKRVFEPFFTTKDVGIGTGLGLSVSFFIITENHGGTLSVESAPGRGSKFIIRLPMADDGVLKQS